MRILVVGAGGVGTAAVAIAARRGFFEHIVVADYDPARVEHALGAGGRATPRFSGARVDASDVASIVALIREHGITHVLNAVDPRFVMPIFDACYEAGVDYMDMAMSLSRPHPDKPFELTGEKLGDRQFEMASALGGRRAGWRSWAWAWSPACPTSSPATPRTSCSARSTRPASATAPTWSWTATTSRPSFSIWTTIEECLNPPVDLGGGPGLVHHAAVLRARDRSTSPAGIGPVECVHVEHEEVLLIPRWVKAKRVTFKYGLGNEFINVLKVLHTLGLDRTDPVTVKGVRGLAARRRGRVPARPGGPRRPDARQDLRRDLGHGHGQGRRAAAGLPLPRGGQRLVLEGVRLAGRRLADGDQPDRRRSSCWPAARGPAPASWARRPSSPSRSWTCWSSTGRPGGCARRRPAG